MLRLGITTLEQLSAKADRGPVRAAVSCQLYEEARGSDETPERRQKLQSEVLRRLRFPNGTYKRTHPSRFDQFDCQVVEASCELAGKGPLRLLDLGVSDATTSVDLWDRLEAKLARELQFVATDKYIEIEIRSHASGRLHFAFDSSGELIQVRHGRFVSNCYGPESWKRFPVNRWLLERKVPRLVTKYRSGEDGDFSSRRVRLIGHRALELERRSPGFQTGECDLFDLPEGPFEVVRAMNILNPGYFDENRLKTALNGIHRVLVPGGLLVVGANEEAGSKVEGGVYRRSASGFEFISQADGACRIHSLIMERATGVS